jgi:hypothetical protein
MSVVSSLTLLALLATLAVKLLLEGWAHVPHYTRAAKLKMLTYFSTAFFFFVLPNRCARPAFGAPGGAAAGARAVVAAGRRGRSSPARPQRAAPRCPALPRAAAGQGC